MERWCENIFTTFVVVTRKMLTIAPVSSDVFFEHNTTFDDNSFLYLIRCVDKPSDLTRTVNNLGQNAGRGHALSLPTTQHIRGFRPLDFLFFCSTWRSHGPSEP